MSSNEISGMLAHDKFLHLRGYHHDGRRDADKGIYSPPHVYTDNDPEYEAENLSYEEGFKQRRSELGDKFRWLSVLSSQDNPPT